ncbi:MAG: YbhB/YbcL family Raf kinase inhibitor-like protein [Acidimicrobiales bacterium]|nr:YbhB/YbcL family Raf kinase inhibitor-like protein [Acidimicrobiales bacterium]
MPRSRPFGASALTTLLMVVTLTAACGSSGRTMRPPTPGATAPPRQTSTTITRPPTTSFTLTAPEFQTGGTLPSDYQCPSTSSPALIWTQPPAGTVELALVVIDVSAGNRVHWLVVAIPANVPGLSKGASGVAGGSLPPGAIELRNSAGAVGWDPPCPADEIHAYSFQLLAFTTPQKIDPGADPEIVRQNLTAAATATATLTVTVNPSGSRGSASAGSAGT